jgi:molybdopterin molybdotransferase
MADEFIEGKNLITIDEAKKLIAENLSETNTEKIELKNSQGRILSEDIIAPDNSPLFDNSAMDGYAVRWTDADKAMQNGYPLSIIGESAAGIEFDGSGSENAAIRISTGAKVPEGFDSVVPIEEVEYEGRSLKILKLNNRGQHIRKAGEEYAKGDMLIEAGVEITTAQIALLASIGKTEVEVYMKPLVTIITTGSELVPYDSDVSGSQIRNSNSIMLEKAVGQSGGEVAASIHVKDNLQKTIDELQTAADDSDIILMSGGVSVGEHDHVKSAAEQAGFEELFWRVNQRPGKPFFFAKRKNCMLFGLPGNPVSALMTYVIYIHQVIGSMQRKDNALTVKIACLDSEIINRSFRDTFFRVRFVDENETVCETSKYQGSHMIMSLVNSDGFIELKGNERLDEHSEVKVNLFPWFRQRAVITSQR